MADERKPMANIPPFGLRMQPDLKARVEESARANNRSLNAEIISRIERSFLADQERADWEKLIAFYSADQKYIDEEYLPGKTDNPISGVPTDSPETEMGKKVNRIITSRTEMMGNLMIRQLERAGLLAPGVVIPSPKAKPPQKDD